MYCYYENRQPVRVGGFFWSYPLPLIMCIMSNYIYTNMANDAIVRFHAESSELENKLKKAVDQFQRVEKEVRRTGATFAVADEKELEFIRSLGSMQTKATSAKGKVAELTNAFTDLSVMYKRMSDEEKKSMTGQALSQSLDQLKTRIKDASTEIKDVTAELGGDNGMSGVLDTIAGKIGIPTDMFTKLGVAAAGVGAAIKVATDAFKQNEELMDDWGRLTESATAIYDGFLNALNTGDLSGFFRNMDDIVLSAQKAYDALDELGTFNAFNQINKEAAKTNFNQAVADYREGKVSREDAQGAAEALKQELEAQADFERAAYEAAVEKLAATRGVNAEMLLKALSGKYGDYTALKETEMPTKSVYNSSTRSFNDVIDYGAATDEQKLGEMLRKFTDDELNAIQALGAQAQRTATEVAQVDKQMVRLLGTSKKTGEIVKAEEVLPEGSIAELKARIAKLNKALEMAADQTTRDNIRLQIQALKDELEMMNADLTSIDSEPVSLNVALAPNAADVLAEEMDKLRERLGLEPIQLGVQVGTDGKGTVDTAKQTEKAWMAAANAVSAIGGALQQIEDPSAKVAGIVMQAVANIALGFAQAAASPATGAAGVFGWIAASTAGLATMLSTIAAIKSATSTNSFSSGGMVGGNSPSGDNIIARLNSGEGVLTANGVSNAKTLAEGSNIKDNLHLSLDVSGTKLRIVLDNDNRSKGGSRGAYSRIK